MALAKLQQKTVEALRGLRDTPPDPGHAQTHEPHEPGRRHPVRLAVVKTPIVPDDSVGAPANSTAGQVAIAGHNGIHPVEDSDVQQTIAGVSGAQIVISGDHTSVVVAGTRLIIDGSTGNDGWHEVDAAPTYDPIPDETRMKQRLRSGLRYRMRRPTVSWYFRQDGFRTKRQTFGRYPHTRVSWRFRGITSQSGRSTKS